RAKSKRSTTIPIAARSRATRVQTALTPARQGGPPPWNRISAPRLSPSGSLTMAPTGPTEVGTSTARSLIGEVSFRHLGERQLAAGVGLAHRGAAQLAAGRLLNRAAR